MRASRKKVSSKTQDTEVQKFYNWMIKMSNIHLADNEQMNSAFIKVSENELQFSKSKN